MAHDYSVKSRSDDEVRQISKKTREFLGVADQHHVDVITCANQQHLKTEYGRKQLSLQIRPNSEMGEDDGSTSFGKGIVTIAIKQSVYDAAIMGEGRARNTFAHELGHAVMHDGPTMSRRTLGNVTPKYIKPFQSAEHQAKVFAPAFLINDAYAQTLADADEIAIAFGISLESAKIYFDQLTAERRRSPLGQRILQFAREFRESTMPAVPKIHYLNDPCNVCGNQTVFPVGTKFMCLTCDTVFDRFQDGDTIA